MDHQQVRLSHEPATAATVLTSPPGSPLARSTLAGSTLTSIPGWENLTERQRMVARLVGGLALTDEQAARRLNLSTHTVNYHLRKIFRELGINSRVRLAGMMSTQPP